MGCRPVLALFLPLLLASSCERSAADAAAAIAAVPSGPRLLEGFEDDPLWTLDSANDYAALSASAADASEGAFGLKVAVSDNRRDKAVIRKEVALDLSRVRRLLIDARNASTQAVTIDLALHATTGALFTTRPRALAPGWNRDLAFELDAGGFAVGADLAQWAAASPTIDRLIIEIHPVKGDCVVGLDNLRADGPVLLRQERARLLAVDAPVGPVARYAAAQILVDVRYPAPTAFVPLAIDPFLARMTSVTARVLAPDGTIANVQGFCMSASPVVAGELTYRYGVRLPTALPGTYRWQIGVGTLTAWTWSVPGALTVAAFAEAASPGPVQRDHANPRWLCRADGSWFQPRGKNVAWSGDYEPYAAAIEANGGTCMRVWICPWTEPLDCGGRLEAINFPDAAHLDAIFATAARHHLVVQLCLTYHGALGWDWARNPWNTANGGPCADAREFWTNGVARAHFQRLLDYCVARWGASADLMAWELSNECDLTPRFKDQDIVDWHREMAAYLHRIDPLHHLVTTSVSRPEALPSLWRGADLDLVEVHGYDAHAPALIDRIAAAFAGQPLPVLLAEWGRGFQAADDQGDRGGVALRQALWSAWMDGLAGEPLPWWWDTHMERNHLLEQVAHLAEFARGEDLRTETWRTLQAPFGEHGVARCLLGLDRAYGYCCDPAAVDRAGAAAEPLLRSPHRIVLRGLPAGTWRLTVWDTATWTVVESGSLGGDELQIDTPETLGECAFKLVRDPPLQPSLNLIDMPPPPAAK